MGTCNTKPKTPDEIADRHITQALKGFHQLDAKSIKILLLGAGECGKSTILKQMKILHEGYKEAELMAMVNLIRENTLTSIQFLIDACAQLNMSMQVDGHSDEEIHQIITAIQELHLDQIPSWSKDAPRLLELRDQIAMLWRTPAMKEAGLRGSAYGMLDSAPYFLDNIERTFSPGYAPWEQDVLRSRKATKGVVQYQFAIEDNRFQMFDVGGQRGERKKWIHCFEDVKAILFVTSLSEYDMTLAEDRTRNRMCESLTLFEGIVNLPWFEKTSIILFFNKKDLFEEKVLRVDLSTTFPEYRDFEHDWNIENAKSDNKKKRDPVEEANPKYGPGLDFIKKMYFERTEREIYPMPSTATNTENITRIWKCIKHIVLQNNLQDSGLLPPG